LLACKETEILILLLDLQSMTFDKIMGGCDLIGRARTGMGKTLAFALPVVELLLREAEAQGPSVGKSGPKPPKVLVMAPTRELAKQVCAGLGASTAAS
jgi:ATP-dependent RNA helicase DDX21